MGPYLAVIKDSFREAMASRILWVLLVVISLLLVALAPFGYREKTTTKLQDGDIVSLGDLMARIQAASELEDKTPAKRIWEKLDEKDRAALKRFKPGENKDGFEMMRTAQRFMGRLNNMIESEDFYDEEYWAKSRLRTSEGRDLLKRLKDGESLSESEYGRLNRLAIETGFPDVIRTGMPTSLQFRYATYPVGPPLPISREDYNQLTTEWASWVMKWFVGVIGVVIAILVTASIIPQMFDPGSLHLLLSNPISRSLLFLSKYLGGCAFTCLSAAYLVGGIWLLLGIRFGIWQLSLLYCIPLFVFVFAIYYAVSALAGVIWRHPLICIALSILFWLACISVGYIKGGYESFALDTTRFTQLHQAGDAILGVNQSGLVKQWDEKSKKWEEVFSSDSQKAMQVMLAFMPEVPEELKPIGPVYDAKNDRLLNVLRDMQGGGGMVTIVGDGDKDWAPKNGAAPPSGMVSLLAEPDGGILAISSYGLYRLTGDPTKKAESKSLFSVIPLPNMAKGPFESVGPQPAVILTRPHAVAINPENGDLALYSRGQLTILNKDEEGKFSKKSEGEIDAPSDKPVTLSLTGDHVLIGREDGKLLLYDSQVQLQKEFDPETQGAAKWVSASPDGKLFAVTYNNGNLWIVNGAEQSARKPNFRGQGDISATLFTNQHTLLTSYQSVRVCENEVDTSKVLNSYAPAMGTMEIAYRYVIYPLYVIFPKPSEMDRTIDYTLAKEEEANKIEKPFEPVWSSLLFIVGVLIISCIYIERQEF